MKNLIDIIKESKTSNKEIKNYVQSWLRQERGNHSYDAILSVIFEAIMDYFKEEMDYYEDKSKIASGKQSKDFDEAADLYAKIKKVYQDWDEI